jgi:hypothetical protein
MGDGMINVRRFGKKRRTNVAYILEILSREERGTIKVRGEEKNVGRTLRERE